MSDRCQSILRKNVQLGFLLVRCISYMTGFYYRAKITQITTVQNQNEIKAFVLQLEEASSH